MPFLLQVVLLAIVQGLAELLPVSSSAHVVVAEKLLGLDPTTPQMTLLLVMLHTGTMFAVIVYFWSNWRSAYFSSATAFREFAIRLIAATALAAAGILILIAGLRERGQLKVSTPVPNEEGAILTLPQSLWMGAVQGVCLPLRGFSRSGATISTGMLAHASKHRAERFSFALAVVLTPPVVAVEALRLLKATHEAQAAGTPIDLHATLITSLLGAVFAFLAGLVALKWLSSWLESGRWYLFGIYCLLASIGVFYLHTRGF